MRRTSVLVTGILALAAICAGARAEQASVLLEAGVYAEEVVGDLDRAIDTYRKIIADAEANRPCVAEAHYRLGKCYLAKGDDAKARAQFAQVAQRYPDQAELVTAAEQQLSKIWTPSDLQLRPAPWSDGEVMRLNLLSMAGAEIGTMIFTVESVQAAGGPAWRLESYLVAPIANTQQYTSVIAERDDFAPIAARTENQMGDFRAQHAPSKVALTVEQGGDKSEREIPVGSTTYDNEQVLQLIRRLPLAKGYRVSFPIFSVQGGAVVECRIEVTGREEIAVPAGEFGCHKIDLSVYSAGVRALQHNVWLTADRHRYLARYDSHGAVMELSSVTVTQKDARSKYGNPDLGVSLTAPPGWHFYDSPSPGAHKFMLYMLPPELKAWAVLTASEGRAPGLTARQVAEADTEALKDYFKGYAVRSRSWADVQVAGLPGVSFVADYQDKARDMVEYRTYLLSSSAVYWFVFRTEDSEFDALRPELDAVVNSLKVADKAPTGPRGPLRETELRRKVEREEEKQAIREAVHAVGLAIEMYKADHDGAYPPSPEEMERGGYLRKEDSLFRRWPELGWRYVIPQTKNAGAVMLYYWPPVDGEVAVLHEDQAVQSVKVGSDGVLRNPRTGETIATESGSP